MAKATKSLITQYLRTKTIYFQPHLIEWAQNFTKIVSTYILEDINDWNTLPIEIVTAPNVLLFKTLFLYDRRFDFR